ncbi:MAG TPA: NAD-dependent deacylase [bacterium]|nr:NAD-dependent deacylase [bacterium]
MGVYEEAARILAGTRKAVSFTGAGVSQESGIPTFRDPGGLWDQFDPEEFGTPAGIMEVFQRRPEVIRQFLLQTVAIFEQAKPNPAHFALSELERMGILTAVITQNIDNLHTDAGNKNVLEVHGNLFRARCTRCDRRYPLDKASWLKQARAILEDNAGFGLGAVLKIMPACECGGITRPDVVMFGEAVLEINQSFRAAMASEVMLVLGTSGVVYPAGEVPYQAKRAGARVIEVNPTENCYSSITDVYIKEPSGQAMPKIMACLNK